MIGVVIAWAVAGILTWGTLCAGVIWERRRALRAAAEEHEEARRADCRAMDEGIQATAALHAAPPYAHRDRAVAQQAVDRCAADVQRSLVRVQRAVGSYDAAHHAAVDLSAWLPWRERCRKGWWRRG